MRKRQSRLHRLRRFIRCSRRGNHQFRRRMMSRKRPPETIPLTFAEIDQRLLLWLARYPLQRAEDLVLGLARWCTRPTVYRHLARLEKAGLITSLRLAISGGSRLFLLSSAGFQSVQGFAAHS